MSPSIARFCASRRARAPVGHPSAPTGYGLGIGADPPDTRAGAERLERHPSLDERYDPAIRIVEHDARWAPRAAAELRRLGDALGSCATRAEHVGSTAVPGLASKPIVDLLLCVARIDPRRGYVEPLERLGYLFVPAPESPAFHFFARPAERPRAYHLHVCASGSVDELRHLAVRDFLRARDDEAMRYAAFKRDLAARHPEDRLAYIAGKDPYVAALEARALRWAAAHRSEG